MTSFMKTLLILLGVIISPIKVTPSGLTGMLIIEKEALMAGVPANILLGICHTESKLKIKALNKNDAGSPSYGICQIKYGTAKWMGFKGTKKELMSMTINVRYAAKYLRYQMDRYNGDLRKAVLAYNMGSYKAQVKNKKTEIAFNESYYKKVLAGSRVDTSGIF